jgi:FSR family fosmidomycin resistance protein-like MFS transporter
MEEQVIQDKTKSITPTKSRRVLFAGCLAHATHDGFTDMLYVFFPIWQQTFQLSFAQIGLLKALFSGAMSGFQLPSGILASRTGILKVLCLGTVLTCVCAIAAGIAWSPIVLGLFLFLGGVGSSTQHPLASSAISNSYQGKASRVALSTYNLFGDVGKLIIPATAAVLIAFAGWRSAISLVGIAGLLSAAVIFVALRSVPLERKVKKGTAFQAFSFRRLREFLPFASLSVIGILDSGTRMGFLTFLPFLLRDKGAAVTTIGLALSLIFAGGAVGKFVCGVIATRVGVLGTVIFTELMTAVLIYGIIGLPLSFSLFLCPLVGIALNGTSSVLYGSVPELVAEDIRNQAFAFFYTCTVGGGAVSPAIYGLISDATCVKTTVLIISAVILTTIPLTLPLRGKVGQEMH